MQKYSRDLCNLAESYVRNNVSDESLQEFFIFLVKDYLTRLQRCENREIKIAQQKKQGVGKQQKETKDQIAKQILDKVLKQNQVSFTFKNCKASVLDDSESCIINFEGISVHVEEKLKKIPVLVVGDKILEMGDEKLIEYVNKKLTR